MLECPRHFIKLDPEIPTFLRKYMLILTHLSSTARQLKNLSNRTKPETGISSRRYDIHTSWRTWAKLK